MIICHCAGVSDATIARHIEEGAASLADITRLTGAGRCCAPCREEIANLLTDRQQGFTSIRREPNFLSSAPL